jgi:hypothetical protein
MSIDLCGLLLPTISLPPLRFESVGRIEAMPGSRCHHCGEDLDLSQPDGDGDGASLVGNCYECDRLYVVRRIDGLVSAVWPFPTWAEFEGTLGALVL